ncbi:class I SAM-dependent methyltransferase [Pontibacter sp. G13]|uniref:class I SAM-dependent methyltransferase n=1 Tax=Pontibacter sp. G13 TaxID=3074898 RepID=UPI00288A6544|nr:class I SAM-dependent methyltransferase [Pontibacter sp. G13]WNJ20212.1 class I SAM-dependent methyltransferase [Pontibacter sp. G13]
MTPWIKSQTSDRYLAPIRQQIIDRIPDQSHVWEVGCGTGALLLEAAPKLKLGIGWDADPSLIHFANCRRQKMGIGHIAFETHRVHGTSTPPYPMDLAIACLFFHVMPIDAAVEILEQMAMISSRVIIMGFCQPSTQKQARLNWLDQRFTGHYLHFEAYQEAGALAGIIEMARLNIEDHWHTHDESLVCYELSS